MQIFKHSKKVLAFLLLFLFLEKAGLRLWIHTHYHLSPAASSFAKSNEDTTIHKWVSEVGCDCMDDFFIPLSFTDTIIIASPAQDYFEVYYSFYRSSLASHNNYTIQLRGPPAC